MEDYLKRQLLIAGCIYVGQTLVGYSLGWTAPVIPKLLDPDQTPLGNALTNGQISWIGSLLYVGTITGPYITGYLSNVKGRRLCLFLGGVITVFSFIILALSKNVTMIYCGRIIKGIGTGILFVTNLVYIGEIASPNIRGVLLTMTGIFSTLGTLMIYAVGPYVSYASTSWLGAAISVAYIAGIFYVPESPVFEVLIGNEAKAIEILQDLHRPNEIEKVISTGRNVQTSIMAEWTQIFTVKTNRKALFITLTLGILQQMSGIIAVLFFATSIFALAGSSIRPDIATIIIGVTQLLASCATPFFVERAGRKSLLLFSTMCCCLSLALLGYYFYLDKNGHSIILNIQWLPLLCLVLFFISYDFGFGIIPGTFTGEMFRSNVRSSGSTLTVTIGWLFGFGVSSAFGYMIQAWGPDITFWVYAAACFIAFIFTIVFVPETKGKTLLEIQDMLS